MQCDVRFGGSEPSPILGDNDRHPETISHSNRQDLLVMEDLVKKILNQLKMMKLLYSDTYKSLVVNTHNLSNASD